VKIRWSERVAYNGDVDSIVWFQLERRDDGTKHCQKMKRSQRARLGSMERKHDTMRPVTMSAEGEASPGRGNGRR
jgi:hypothetical protein